MRHYNLNEKLGKYICIHCKTNFDKLPIIKHNECPTGYYHNIVKKKKLEKIFETREMDQNGGEGDE